MVAYLGYNIVQGYYNVGSSCGSAEECGKINKNQRIPDLLPCSRNFVETDLPIVQLLLWQEEQKRKLV
jgi:hypothetical protein